MTSLVAQKRRRFLLQRTLALLLAAALLAVPAASAKTVSVEVPWEKARTIIAEGDFRPKIRVELQSSERLKGKLIEATGTGLRLVRLRYETKIAKSGSGRRQSARRFERQDTETLIERKEIRTIRLRPRKTTRNKDQRAYLNRMLRLRWRPCARKKKTGSCAGLSYVASTNERQLRVQSLVDKAVFKSSHCVQLQCIYRVWVSRYP